MKIQRPQSREELRNGSMLRRGVGAIVALSLVCGWLPLQIAMAAPATTGPTANVVERPIAAPSASAQQAPASNGASPTEPVLRSTKGRDFRLAIPNPAGALLNSSFRHDYLLFISSEYTTTGMLSIADGAFTPLSFTVGAGQVVTMAVPGSGIRVHHTHVAPPGISSKSLRVTATADVSVYALPYIQASVDAVIGIPNQSAGMEYVVAAYLPFTPPNPADPPAAATSVIVAALEDATQITVTYQMTNSRRTVLGYIGSNSSSGRITDAVIVSTLNATPPVSTMVLNAGQVFVREIWGVDVSGSIVESNKPVVVYGYSSSSFVPAAYGASDQLFETMPPVPSWGRRYIAMPVPNRAWGDTFRIFAAQNNTPVYVNGRLLGTIGRGQWIEHRTQTINTKYFTSTKPIMVQQYSNSQTFDNTTGDPSMITIQPLEQGMTRYLISTPKDKPQSSSVSGGSAEYVNTLNIVAPDAPGVKVYIDGVRVTNLISVGNGFRTATASITPGAHAVTGTVPFLLSMMGLRAYESYGYPGGSNYVDLSRVATLSLFPNSGDYLVQNGNRCFIATVKDQDGVGVPGLPVYFYAPGNVIMAGANANENGQATVCYTGRDGDVGLTATAAWLEVQSDVRWRSVLSSRTDLHGLQVAPGQLAPAFVSNTTQYTVSVPNATTSILVTPTLTHSGIYTITSSPEACAPANSPASCSLQIGLNTITVTVTSEDGSAKSEYVTSVLVKPTVTLEESRG